MGAEIMNKKIQALVTAGAFLGMGIAMPSCPGQQAMQQQIDTLQTKTIELTQKISKVDSQNQILAKWRSSQWHLRWH